MSNKTVSSIKIVNNKIVTTKKQNNNGNDENKRSLSSSSSPSQSPTIVNSKKTKLFFTPNRFSLLSTYDYVDAGNSNINIDDPTETSNQGQPNTTNDTSKSIWPPPIFIKSVHDYIGLHNHLKDITGPDSFSCKSTSTHLKIQADTPDNYRKIIHCLKENNAQYHTYQL